MNNVIIYPVHLFDVKLLPKEWKKANIYIIEDPVYWGTDKNLKLNMNQLKLVLHRASMKYYLEYLKDKGFKNVYYVEEAKLRSGYAFLSGGGPNVQVFDPVDHTVMNKLKKEVKKRNKELKVIDSPGFLLKEAECLEFLKARKKGANINHGHFYSFVKKKLGLIKEIGTKTYDEENRKPLPTGVKIVGIPKMKANKWVKEAQGYVRQKYGKNYGKVDAFYIPVTHSESQSWFRHFLAKKFAKFGDYQDAITQKHPWIFHSVIAPMMNVGLLDPKWVVDETIKYYKKNKRSIGKNDFEGFLRQILGWREYSRMLYIGLFDEVKGNHFGHKRKLTSSWYTGKLGIEPVDWTINVAFETGYLHHILRLMMMANFMNLCELHPDEVFKWFMEFSMDSYQWVMHNNIYGMGTYADGGLTMRKPYLSSSNYILNMSDFNKDGEWDVIWTDLFYRFLVKHENKLKGTPYLRNLAHYKKKSAAEKRELMSRANNFIKRVTRG